MSRFERGAVRLLSGGPIAVSDARLVQTGTINVDGAAANCWAELHLDSEGTWFFKGSARSTGALSYDVLLIMSVDLRALGGPLLTFAEKGDVEGTLVLGGNRAHVWSQEGSDARIRDNWELIRNADVSWVFKVEFGPGDVLALVATILGVPLAAIGILLGGAWLGDKKKACGYVEGHERYDSQTGQWVQDRGVVIVDKNKVCPAGTFR